MQLLEKLKRPEFQLAFQITGAILAILVTVVLAASYWGNKDIQGRIQFIFAKKAAVLQSQPQLLWDFLEEQNQVTTGQTKVKGTLFPKENLPFQENIFLPEHEGKGGGKNGKKGFMFPGSRNLIVLSQKTITHIIGPLEKKNFDPKLILSLHPNQAEERSFDSEKFLCYAFLLQDKFIILYEPIEFIYGQKTSVFTSLLGGIFLFSILLFIAAINIARRVIAPIEALAEKERAYARHIAHELKTPLAIIKSDLELALMTPEENDERLKDSIIELRSMSQTVDDLLLLSASEASLQKNPLDFKSLIDALLKQYTTSIPFEVQLDDFPSTIEADERLTKTLLKNIIVNTSTHALPNTKAIISYDKKENCLIFENKVTTMPQNLFSRVFEPFVGTPGKGSGIGLSLVKRIAELHHWNVVFEKKDETTVSLKVFF